MNKFQKIRNVFRRFPQLRSIAVGAPAITILTLLSEYTKHDEWFHAPTIVTSIIGCATYAAVVASDVLTTWYGMKLNGELYELTGKNYTEEAGTFGRGATSFREILKFVPLDIPFAYVSYMAPSIGIGMATGRSQTAIYNMQTIGYLRAELKKYRAQKS